MTGGRFHTVAERLRVEFSGRRHALRREPADEELLGGALAEGRSLDALIESFKSPGDARFFFEPGNAARIAGRLERALPGWGDETAAAADRIRERVFRLLGADRLSLAGYGSIPWHRDALRDYRWNPRTYYRKIRIPYDRADIKLPWELSRCQHLPTLGMAYASGRGERYAAEAVAQIDDWISANPPGKGVNWACTMDVAIRAVNWIWAYHLISGAQAVTDDFLVRLLAGLLRHARHIDANIEVYDRGVTTNHTLADYVGLLYLGFLLPDLEESSAWADRGWAGVLSCMRSQVTEDGVDYENSIPYHRLVLEMLLGSSVLADRVGRSFPTDYGRSLERMLEFVQHYTRPDGRAPLIGDSDDGRLQILSRYFEWDPQDHRYLLAVGGTVFDRADFRAASHGAPGVEEELAWLLGGEDLERPEPPSPPPLRSASFPLGGRYVMRHGEHHAVISADEIGTGGMGNHKHNDIFSFELSVRGTPVAVDPGSFAYTGDLGARDAFRSVRAHSTVSVDGREQNRFKGPFGMSADAEVSVSRWSCGTDFDVFQATHSGYERLDDPVAHQRTIVFGKDPFAWLVVDRLSGRRSHALESFLHLAPGGNLAEEVRCDRAAVERAVDALASGASIERLPEPRPEGALGYARDGVQVTIVPLGLGEFSVCDGWFAPRYGQRVKAPVLLLGGHFSLPAVVGYLLLLGGGEWG